ncbi:MAG: hypothetical protein ACRC9L_09370 [Brevinema sp.]
MKKVFYIVSLCVLAVPTWSKIGTHNLLINVSAGPSIFYTSFNADNIGSGISLGSVEDVDVIGLMGIELGYLLHRTTGKGTIHGMDFRLGVFGDLPYDGYHSDGTSYKNPIIFNVALNYTPGIQFKSMRLLFDVIGINISSAFAHATENSTGRQGTVYSPAFMLTLPLGSHFLLKSGIYFGFRHHLIINPFAHNPEVPKLKYTVMFNLGFAFGR